VDNNNNNNNNNTNFILTNFSRKVPCMTLDEKGQCGKYINFRVGFGKTVLLKG